MEVFLFVGYQQIARPVALGGDPFECTVVIYTPFSTSDALGFVEIRPGDE
jgi:hypothetical protein